MKKFVLRRGNDKFYLKQNERFLSDDDFTYTQSGNDITVNSYVGSDTDVTLLQIISNYFVFARPSDYKLRVDDYNYTFNNEEVVLTKYIGSGGDIVTPTKKICD